MIRIAQLTLRVQTLFKRWPVIFLNSFAGLYAACTSQTAFDRIIIVAIDVYPNVSLS